MLKWLILILFISFPTSILAHGVKGYFSITKGVVLILAQYDDGEPMAYSKVEIKADNTPHPYQIGFTDPKGRFLFIPDKHRLWTVTVKDGIGHMLKLEIPIHKTSLNKKQTENLSEVKPKILKYEAICMGLSAIFAIFGLLFWIKGLNLTKKNKNHHSMP